MRLAVAVAVVRSRPITMQPLESFADDRKNPRTAPGLRLSRRGLTLCLVTMAVAGISVYAMFPASVGGPPLPVAVSLDRQPMETTGGQGAMLAEVVVVENKADCELRRISIEINGQYLLFQNSPLTVGAKLVFPQSIFTDKKKQPTFQPDQICGRGHRGHGAIAQRGARRQQIRVRIRFRGCLESCMNDRSLTERWAAWLKAPLSKTSRTLLLLGGIVLPILAHLATIDGVPSIGSRWQSGDLHEQLAFILTFRAGFVLYPLIGYAIVSLLLYLFRRNPPANSYWLPLGIVNGVLVSLWYFGVFLICLTEQPTFDLASTLIAIGALALISLIPLALWLLIAALKWVCRKQGIQLYQGGLGLGLAYVATVVAVCMIQEGAAGIVSGIRPHCWCQFCLGSLCLLWSLLTYTFVTARLFAVDVAIRQFSLLQLMGLILHCWIDYGLSNFGTTIIASIFRTSRGSTQSMLRRISGRQGTSPNRCADSPTSVTQPFPQYRSIVSCRSSKRLKSPCKPYGRDFTACCAAVTISWDLWSQVESTAHPEQTSPI